MVSITVLCILIVGGMGSIRGVLFGAAIVMGFDIFLKKATEAMQQAGLSGSDSVFLTPSNWKFLFFGLALVIMMRFRPARRLPRGAGFGGARLRGSRRSESGAGRFEDGPGRSEARTRGGRFVDMNVLELKNLTVKFGGLDRGERRSISIVDEGRDHRRSSAPTARERPPSSTRSPESTSRPTGEVLFLGRDVRRPLTGTRGSRDRRDLALRRAGVARLRRTAIGLWETAITANYRFMAPFPVGEIDCAISSRTSAITPLSSVVSFVAGALRRRPRARGSSGRGSAARRTRSRARGSAGPSRTFVSSTT